MRSTFSVPNLVAVQVKPSLPSKETHSLNLVTDFLAIWGQQKQAVNKTLLYYHLLN